MHKNHPSQRPSRWVNQRWRWLQASTSHVHCWTMVLSDAGVTMATVNLASTPTSIAIPPLPPFILRLVLSPLILLQGCNMYALDLPTVQWHAGVEIMLANSALETLWIKTNPLFLRTSVCSQAPPYEKCWLTPTTMISAQHGAHICIFSMRVRTTRTTQTLG